MQDPKLSGSEEVDLDFLVNGGLDVDPTFAVARGCAVRPMATRSSIGLCGAR